MFLKYFTSSLYALFALWIVYLFFAHTYSIPLENWDEAFYADTIRNMVETKVYSVPFWNSHPFIDKPPLYYWLSTPFVRVFGFIEISYRLVSILSSLMVILFLWKHMTKSYGLLPAIISSMWLISNTLFLYRTRGGNMDGLVTLLILLSFLSFKSKHRHKHIFFSIFVGLIFLTKATLAVYLLPIGVYMLLRSYTQTRSVTKSIPILLKLILPGLIIVGLWLGMLGIHQGFSAVSYFLFSADQGVAHLSMASLSQRYIHFLRESASSVFFGLSIVGFLYMIYHFKRFFGELYFAGALLVLLSASPVHNNWYILPILPFWALASGYGVGELQKTFQRYIPSRIPIKLLMCGILFIVIIQHGRIYQRSLRHIINPQRNESIKALSLFVRDTIPDDAQLVRLDSNYTVTAYYAHRFTMSSSPSDSKTNFFIVTRPKLKELLDKNSKNKYVLAGEASQVKSYIQDYPAFYISYSIGDQALAQNF